ncbi:A disintegrin and metallopeptidase domain 3-like [Castor canadensis]|uniref:A disintegrin and metallopeptidase domain 3-like n=1 Tax=Castor canadensis TaxID=51338 RepID=A0AC58LUA2_CASCN
MLALPGNLSSKHADSVGSARLGPQLPPSPLHPNGCLSGKTGAHTMLSLLLVLSGLGRLTSTGLYFETPLLQITVPRKIETNTKDGKEPEAHVTYLISFEGKTYTLLLKKQSFLHPNFLTYSYSKLGALQTESSFIKSHCFYQGHAAEIPRSVVTLSTCSGLRGLLQLENSSYGIEPLESSATYEHMFYEVKNNKIDYSPLKEHYPKLDQSYRILVKPEKYSDIAQSKRTMKMRLFVDKALYDYMGSEIGVATQKIVLIFGLINTMFSQINMTIMLSSLEVWSDKNRISTDGDADEVLQRFLKWKQKSFSQRPNDMAYLLLYKDHPDYVGATYHGTACDPRFAAGIALHPKAITLEAFSVVIAQLLGINLGLTYDDIYNCYCPGSSCIMNPEAM